MFIANKITDLRSIVSDWHKLGLKIGVVPTMGYLHEGHESLIKRAVKENDKVIVTNFVNPMQFGPKEDLSIYPRDFKRDTQICENAGAHIIFAPTVEEMYESNFSSFVDMTGLTEELCGASRPGHFRGVCTVVTKLFNITKADRAYFGEKDAQQLAVIRHMVRDLNMDIEIIGCPIIREEDGLAKSSRNTYLSKEERSAALVLSQSLSTAKNMLDAGERNAVTICNAIKEKIEAEPLARIDYVSIVDGKTLRSVSLIEHPVLIALAVYIGKTKLIDNISYFV